MQYKTLIRNKYSPKNLDGFFGQTMASTILKNMIIKDLIYPSLLFFGTYGVGKTSMAKIFAKAINCENNKGGIHCDQCTSCLLIQEESTNDFMEIDGATYNGVDNIRFIIENAQYAPRELKYKVFIIDECHMLTREAFNSFLKTLEYPPENIIFILITTELRKIPDTIRSRCISVNFSKVNDNALLSLCLMIDKEEKLHLDKDVQNILVEKSNGSARDLLVLMDEVIFSGTKTARDLTQVFGYCTQSDVFNIYFSILNGNLEGALKTWKEIFYNGCLPTYFLHSLLSVVNHCIIFKNTNTNTYSSKNYIKQEIKKISNKFLLKHWEIIMYMIDKSNVIRENYVEMVLIMLSIIEGTEKEREYISILQSMFPNGSVESLY